MGEFKLNFTDFYKGMQTRELSAKGEDTKQKGWMKINNGRDDFFRSMESKCECLSGLKVDPQSFDIKNNITEIIIHSGCDLKPNAFKNLIKLQKITLIDYKGDEGFAAVSGSNKRLTDIILNKKVPKLTNPMLNGLQCTLVNIQSTEKQSLVLYQNQSYDLSKINGLAPYTFAGNKNITSMINLPQELPNGLFASCTSLTNMVLNNIKTVGDACFKDCTSLTLQIDTDIPNLGKDCFTNVGKVVFDFENCPNVYKYCSEREHIINFENSNKDSMTLDELNKAFDDLEEVVNSNWEQDSSKWDSLANRVNELRVQVNDEAIDFKTFKQTFLDIQKDFNSMK